MTLAWDVSRTSGRGGIRLDWEERKGWYYALTGFDAHDVLLYTAVTVLRTPMAAPETVADVAEELVRRRQLPDHEFRAEWDGARDVRAAAGDFRRSRLGLGPLQLREGATDSTKEAGPGVQLTIDAQADTYERSGLRRPLACYRASKAKGRLTWPRPYGGKQAGDPADDGALVLPGSTLRARIRSLRRQPAASPS
ncbi:hypothetical protein QFZ22_000488 [Streptomyces canus]|uniref:Uncharacterized protein n=1 Tax=Streptomyces canus TaxID=58343 RepID=A0AAW8F4U8_9ACTN|nr:DUF6292 family protein [Streptomyces canus]MDQ0904503.1 hypothetical protein [Streptomyces canus]